MFPYDRENYYSHGDEYPYEDNEYPYEEDWNDYSEEDFPHDHYDTL